jgi:Cu(I)/Ag(I) efflux system membrane fusion protein
MKRAVLIVISLVAAVAIGAGGFYLGRRSPGEAPTADAIDKSATDKKVLYWHDPMVPGPRFDKPGKSPFMDMQLVPVYADGDAADAGVKVSPTVQQNLGIRYAAVRRAELPISFDAVGTVQFDERLSVVVQTRAAGYVEQLRVRAPMERVRKGQPHATVFSPEWLGPQNELLALQRAGVAPELVAAARERLKAMSIPDELVRQSEAAGTAQARYTLSAPVGGVVAELGVREGVAVTPGMTLFRIAGLEKVWAVAEVPEAQAARLARGQKVKAALQADAGRVFDGTLTEIVPQVSASTRTLQARFEVDNREGQLAPGMLLRLQVAGPASARLLVPTEAVIRTGRRAIVMVRNPAGGFEARDVSVGAEIGDEIEITQGVKEGEEVVASGQFLIDSEARLRSVTGSMAAPAASAASAPPAAAASASMPTVPVAGIHAAEGKVESVSADDITISHGPVASLKWPPMTMGFGKPDAKAFADVKPGDTVRFEFREGGASGYELVSVQRVRGGK